MADQIGPNMVSIPQGSISLRDDRTGEKWKTKITPFSLSTCPIDQSLYAEVAGTWPSTKRDGRCPVETVTWYDAVNFCNALSRLNGLKESYEISSKTSDVKMIEHSKGYRLPSEAEWQYACQAGVSDPRYGELDDIGWYAMNSGGSTHPSGEKQPNAWGLYDMLGNVWEWCSDVYDPVVYGSYRIFRGGGWADKERGCLATNRRRSHPTFSIDDLGFRVARTP
ncbi:MAG: formylglycine-generating enzyme family protein [Lentilitoribacter sp.]